MFYVHPVESEERCSVIVIDPKSEFFIYSSVRLLFEDQDSGLFSVTLFRKAIDDFKQKARENK